MADINQEGFEERADHLELSELEEITVEAEFFKKITDKLLQRGAKLIVGPRGTGKTHQMRYSYIQCLQKKKNPIAIYVTFTKYYHLEPLLHKAPNALKLFHTWVLSKILQSCYEVLFELKLEPDLFIKEFSEFNKAELDKYIAEIEKGSILDSQNKLIESLTLSVITNAIERLIELTDRKRAVLFFDDAALTLTEDYMIEFFDVFKALKSSNIAPKASVYPGSTQYGPRFNVRHDVEAVNAWLSVEDESYSLIMGEVINKRMKNIDKIPSDVVELFKYAAFGVPRILLTMLRDYEQSKQRTSQQKVNNIINSQHTLLIEEYRSLSLKLPQFKTIIEAGLELYSKIIRNISKENKNLIPKDEKQLRIGIQQTEQNHFIDRMIKLLIEIGLLHYIETVSHGEDREYDRYIPHIASLINSKAFSVGRGFSAQKMVEVINLKPAKHPLRRKINTLLSDKVLANLKLDLPLCQVCNTQRITELQKFCHNCGSPLVEQSTFENCMEIKIEELPLTQWQKDKINKETKISKVKDFFTLQDPGSELRKARGIGKVKSKNIHDIVLQEVEEFLS